MPESDGFDLPPKWQSAADTIKDLMAGGEAMLLAQELPEGPGSKVGIEKLAREYLKVTPQSDLGIIYSILGVATCVAAQGAYVLLAPIKGGKWLEIPAIQMVLGIAPSGWGKSSALDLGMGPLNRALASGVSDRRTVLPRLKQKAIDDFNNSQAMLAAPLVADEKQFKEVYDGGICAKTLTTDPTQEALRNQIVRNGGIAGCLAGEPDIFRSMIAYSLVPASLTLFLNLWDQREINTTRVSDMDLQIEEAALALCVLFQPEVFAEVTSGSARSTGSGADSFISRGMFGRIWVVETENKPDYRAIAAAYADDNDFTHNPDDPDGYSTADGQITDLGSAAIDFDLALQDLVRDSNQFRTDKAIHQAWDVAATKYGTDLQVPEPNKPMRHAIHIGPEAREMYRRCQRMMAQLQEYISESEEPDTKALWDPIASRLTQHILREALVMTLAAGQKTSPTDPLAKEPFEVTAEFIEDAATRVLPWRWCMTANALTRRAHERAEDALAQAVTVSNPKMRDMSPTGMIRDLIFDLAAAERDTAIGSGFSKTEILKWIQARLPRGSARNNVSAILTSTLAGLSADITSGIQVVPGRPNAVGKPGVRYTVRVPSNF